MILVKQQIFTTFNNLKYFSVACMSVASCAFTSFYNGLAVFSLLGYMAESTGRTVQEIASESGILNFIMENSFTLTHICITYVSSQQSHVLKSSLLEQNLTLT